MAASRSWFFRMRLRWSKKKTIPTILADHEPRVLGLLRRLVRDAATAEDLCQETFLRVLRGLPHFRAESGLGTQIYRVAHNVAVDHLRAREPGDSLDARAEEGYDPPDPGSAPTAAVEGAEMRRAVEEAMSALPAPLIAVLSREVAPLIATLKGLVAPLLQQGWGPFVLAAAGFSLCFAAAVSARHFGELREA